MIGQKFNFEDSFFRDLTVCVLDTLEGEIKWTNRFSSGDRIVNVPFYYSLTGDERFLLDSFSDDVVSDNRLVDLNTDIIPRAHITLTGYDIRSDEFANPNVWLKMVLEHDDEVRRVLTKIRAIPISAKYDLTILLSSEIDTFKCSQAIMDTIWLYRFMYFEHNFMNIDAVMLIPDTNQIQIQREKSMTSDNQIKLTLSFDVQTYYPAYRRPTLPSSISYPIQTTYLNSLISVKVQISRGNLNNIIFTEYHNLVTNSEGIAYLMIGSGTKFDFSLEEFDKVTETQIENYYTHPSFKYKKYVTDTNGDPIPNQPFNTRYSILQNTESGEILYQEIKNLVINSNSEIDYEFGLGSIQIGNLLEIDFRNGIYFLKVEIDSDNDDVYELVETILFSAEFTGESMKYDRNVSSNPLISVNQGVGLKVKAIVSGPIQGTTNQYRCFWPYLPPNGVDKKTNDSYVYGNGSLEDISALSPMDGLISENFSPQYSPILRDVSENIIRKEDPRDWFFNYETGTLTQNKLVPTPTIPETMEVWYRFDKSKTNNLMNSEGGRGTLMDLYNNRNGLRITIGVDPNGGDKYEKLVDGEILDVSEFQPDPNSNSSDYGRNGMFEDTVTNPKRSKWYYDNKGTKSITRMGIRVPRGQNQNLNVTKYPGKFFK
jgi:hypothetical protein